ncbi:MAG TPA: glycosyltransferase family 39 protein [Planctomycetota bacterium]|nr:glycosyltransferase family 39 protein [Planctomycetota bacterium]
MQGTPIKRRLDLDRPAVRHATAAGLGLLALLLRLFHLDTQPLWFDEALTAHIAHAPDGLDFVHNTPPLYFEIVRHWGAWFGYGEAGLRCPSALAGALFVWATLHCAREVFGNRTALAAALLALLAPLHLYYSQEARAYALMLFEVMVAYWMVWRLARGSGSGTWLVLVLASTAALYTHYLSAIPLAIGFVVIALPRPDEGRRLGVAAIASAGGVACLALLPWLVWWSRNTAFDPSDMQWLELLWKQASVVGLLSTSIEMFLLGGQAGHAPITLKQMTWLPFPEPLRVVGLAAMAALLGHVVVSWRRASRPMRVATMQCLVLLLVPLFGLCIVSMVRPVYCAARYDLIAWPAFVLLMGRAIASATTVPNRWGRGAAWVVVAALASVIVAKDQRYFAAPPGPDLSGRVASFLTANVAVGETVVLCGPVGLPVLVRWYGDGFVWSDRKCRQPATGREFGCRLLPSSLETAPAAETRYLRAVADGSLVSDLAEMVRSGAPGFWLVLGDDMRAGSDAALERAGRALFSVLLDAGYTIAGGDPSLGIAHLVRKR